MPSESINNRDAPAELAADVAVSPEGSKRRELKQSENKPSENEPAGTEKLVTEKLVMEQLEMELNRIRRTLRLTAERRLQTLAGGCKGGLAGNQQWVREIHRMLENHGLRVMCSECGHPAILRVSPRSGMRHGAFVFDHTIEGRRTFHGGSGRLPIIRLVAKPQRRAAGG